MGPSEHQTAEDKRWIEAIVDFGCIACCLDGYPGTPPCVHHIVDFGRRMGHRFSLPLCPGHHQHDSTSGKIALHPGRSKAFIAAYGTELQLLHRLETLLGFDHVGGI